MSDIKWCKHEKTKTVYHAYSSPPEIVQCCLCGACHIERSWKDHKELHQAPPEKCQDCDKFEMLCNGTHDLMALGECFRGKITSPKPAPEDVISKTELTCKKESLHCGPCCACTRIKNADLATPEADQLKAVELLEETLMVLFDVGIEGVSGGWLQLSPLDFKVSKLLKDVEKFLNQEAGG